MQKKLKKLKLQKFVIVAITHLATHNLKLNQNAFFVLHFKIAFY